MYMMPYYTCSCAIYMMHYDFKMRFQVLLVLIRTIRSSLPAIMHYILIIWSLYIEKY